MRSMSLALLAVMCCFFSACGEGHPDNVVTPSNGAGVYVCTGKGASVWHCKRNCGALKNCDGDIIFTANPGSQYKSACKRCY